MVAILWIPAFAGMTGANRSGGAVIVPLNLASTYSCKPIKGEGTAGGDLYLISGGELGCSLLDSRFRGNDGGRERE